ncbi:hypothetical protein [Parafrigoribacterium soli]|uniref:hypothetical protein n=1 Tax=Parafrigoribacterium soli TaxID=3144663 RepID=UPI0032EDFD59
MTDQTPSHPSRQAPGSDSTSTKVTEQRALTSGNGNNWLVIGGILTLICGGILFAMQRLEPAAVAFTGLVIVVVLYAAMVVVRLVAAPGRRMLWSLAALTILIVITFFVCGGIVTATEWSGAAIA